MKRIKLVLVTVVAIAVMAASASPALARHGWEWTEWWQWGNTNWWCSALWHHGSGGNWSFEQLVCWHPRHGFWNWP